MFVLYQIAELCIWHSQVATYAAEKIDMRGRTTDENRNKRASLFQGCQLTLILYRISISANLLVLNPRRSPPTVSSRVSTKNVSTCLTEGANGGQLIVAGGKRGSFPPWMMPIGSSPLALTKTDVNRTTTAMNRLSDSIASTFDRLTEYVI